MCVCMYVFVCRRKEHVWRQFILFHKSCRTRIILWMWLDRNLFDAIIATVITLPTFTINFEFLATSISSPLALKIDWTNQHHDVIVSIYMWERKKNTHTICKWANLFEFSSQQHPRQPYSVLENKHLKKRKFVYK